MALFPKEDLLTDFSKLNKLLYGFPKSGKTTFASAMYSDAKLPPFFIATEEGHGALSLSRQRVTTWEGFVRFLAYLEQHKAQLQAEHSCIVLDLLSDLDEMCSNFTCEAEGVKSLADLEYGKGWTMLRVEFRKQINRLFAILPCVFICHSAEKEITWNEEKIKVQSPNLSKQALEFANGKVDLIMWIAPANSGRSKPEIIMEPSMTCISGSRYPQLLGNYVLEPADPHATYAAIAAAFTAGVPAQTKVEGA